MHRGVVIVLALAVIAVGVAVSGSLVHANAPVAHRLIDRDVDLSGVQRLEVRSGAADVHVRVVPGRTGAHVHADLRSIGADAMTLSAGRSGSTATVVLTERQQRHVHVIFGGSGSSLVLDVEIGTPVAVTVDTGSGDVTAVDTPRAFSGRTGSGDIRVTDPRGAVDAHTGSGDVSVALRDGFTSDVGVQTGSGDVELRVPRGMHALVDAHTLSGALHDDAGIARATAPLFTLRSGSGDIHLAAR